MFCSPVSLSLHIFVHSSVLGLLFVSYIQEVQVGNAVETEYNGLSVQAVGFSDTVADVCWRQHTLAYVWRQLGFANKMYYTVAKPGALDASGQASRAQWHKGVSESLSSWMPPSYMRTLTHAQPMHYSSCIDWYTQLHYQETRMRGQITAAKGSPRLESGETHISTINSLNFFYYYSLTYYHKTQTKQKISLPL